MAPRFRAVLCTVSTVTADQYGTGRVLINVLPDEVLLHVFRFYRANSLDPVNGTWGWQRLVHVCRAWRRTILESQNALDLRLLCTERTPVRKTMGIWPLLPIIIEYRHVPSAISQSATSEDLGDLVAALRHHARVCRITLSLTGPLMGTIISAMRQPCPMLTYLRVQLCGDAAPAPALPDGFLGGLAPRLEKIRLEGIRFPSLPKFLLGASGLVELRLDKIPDTWDISPQTLSRCLSTLPKLRSLSIEFQYRQSPPPEPTLRHSPPPMRSVLPALAILFYKGESEYFEDLVSKIDAPRLSYAFIKFFNQLIFDIVELPRFISRTEKLRTLNRAEAFFDGQAVGIGFYRPETTVPRNLTVRIACNPSDWQLSSLAQLCNQSLSLLSRVEQLDIRDCHSREPHLQEMAQWVDLLHPFTAVESLRIPRELGTRIAPVLCELAEPRAAEVLPALNSLIFEELEPLSSSSSESGSLQQAIDGFVAARKRSDHPVDVRRWDGK